MGVKMYWRYLLGLPVFILLFCSFTSAGAEVQNSKNFVYTVSIDGDIYEGTSTYILDAINEAESHNVPLIIELNTPGGLVSSTRKIVEGIMETDVEVVVWVTPPGAWAYSAGTYILMASHIAAMDVNTAVGAAEPRPSDNKTVSAMAGWMREIAAARGRPAEIAERFVTQNRVVGPENALEENLIDLIATDEQDILERLGIPGADIRHISASPLSTLLDILSNPQVVIILFIAGLVGIIAEITTPGVGLPGVAGAICLLLSLWGLNVIEVGLLGLALLALGAVLLVTEIFVPGFGVFGIGGVVSVLLGLLMIGKEPWVELGNVVIGVAMGLVVLLGLFVFFARKALRRLPRGGIEDMVGEIGVVTKTVDPLGVVRVRGELWEATSEERIERGEEVLVESIGTEGGRTRLIVKKRRSA